MGMIYTRGDIYWLQYYRNGKKIRESSKSTSKMVAERRLKRREGEIAQGKIPSVQFEKVTFDELAEGLLLDYRINNKKSIDRAQRSVNLLKKHFGGFKATQITTPLINSYVVMRMDTGAANATINRELAALKRMLNLGAQQTPPLVNRVPYIPMLKENNTRKGFFEHQEFIALRNILPRYLNGFVTFAYQYGWRLEEVAGLTWKQVDRQQGIVRLEVLETKNDDARTVYLDEELKKVFQQQFIDRQLGCQYIFHNSGKKIGNFRRSWNTACRQLGIGFGYRVDKNYVIKWENKLPPGPTLHDFRRTAVRNMVRAGIPEKVAMTISGHRTRSVFDRYNIVNDQDLKRAAKQQASYFRSLHGHNLGTIC
jgi:integrase